MALNAVAVLNPVVAFGSSLERRLGAEGVVGAEGGGLLKPGPAGQVFGLAGGVAARVEEVGAGGEEGDAARETVFGRGVEEVALLDIALARFAAERDQGAVDPALYQLVYDPSRRRTVRALRCKRG